MYPVLVLENNKDINSYELLSLKLWNLRARNDASGFVIRDDMTHQDVIQVLEKAFPTLFGKVFTQREPRTNPLYTHDYDVILRQHRFLPPVCLVLKISHGPQSNLMISPCIFFNGSDIIDSYGEKARSKDAPLIFGVCAFVSLCTNLNSNVLHSVVSEQLDGDELLILNSTFAAPHSPAVPAEEHMAEENALNTNNGM